MTPSTTDAPKRILVEPVGYQLEPLCEGGKLTSSASLMSIGSEVATRWSMPIRLKEYEP